MEFGVVLDEIQVAGSFYRQLLLGIWSCLGTEFRSLVFYHQSLFGIWRDAKRVRGVKRNCSIPDFDICINWQGNSGVVGSLFRQSVFNIEREVLKPQR